MPGPYSPDLRERVLLACEEKACSYAGIARRFRIAESTLYQWMSVARDTGRRTAKPHGRGFPTRLAGNEAQLQQIVQERNDATLEEYVEILNERCGILVSVSTMGRYLDNLKLTRKKRH